uniref:Uncharacterized protein n=1 Tax=Candidatus Kentrum sp. MB TaxID=2138164 RepID=A0A450XZ69_9GAMM|nr:MAG: hypothetical protein BECKMB1821G_GA0114241_10774 [Candidatus Kentron sp. MB]VFK34555.1 MAG: hypothetical protein BECKMB1821I_GA0114274_10763 [Candidatus Kentron sp. MB]VFK76875.1 MAG: hypothetical protein BECKMB1821H_GA0114242_10802 [Candidatus Kentron sp. MB]
MEELLRSLMWAPPYEIEGIREEKEKAMRIAEKTGMRRRERKERG